MAKRKKGRKKGKRKGKSKRKKPVIICRNKMVAGHMRRFCFKKTRKGARFVKVPKRRKKR